MRQRQGWATFLVERRVFFVSGRAGLTTRKSLYTMQEEQEILLRENKDRFVILPINYPLIWEKYKKHEAIANKSAKNPIEDDYYLKSLRIFFQKTVSQFKE